MDDRKQLHVAMFPWLAFGHIIPFLELSKLIAQKGHKVSFLSTTRNIQRWSLAFSSKSPQTGLYMILLRFGCRRLQLDLTSGELSSRYSTHGSWLSYDPKTVDDYLTPPKWVPFPTKICYRKHEARSFVGGASSVNASGVSDMYRCAMVFKGSDCMFIRHSYEFEPQWLQLLEEINHLRPVVPVGLLPPETTTNAGDEKDDVWMTWLDGQQKGCVVYVALGSEVMVSKTELGELALGLELSGLPFFWALRKPPGSTESDTIELPDGFLERTRGRGMVWTSWVPQLQILSHESVGAFLTHCGWVSIVEGLTFGHPLIMLPFLGDQSLNARAMVDKHVGIEVPRNEEDGSFTKESVAVSLTSVVFGDEGKIYKANTTEWSRIFSDKKFHKKYVDDFIEYLEKKGRVAATDH